MDYFPDNFNLKTCMDVIGKKQAKLIKEERQNLYDTTIAAVESCEKHVELVFSKKVWPENRNVLTLELLEKFGELKVTTMQGGFDITGVAADAEDIPKNIKSVIIEFWK